jgi:small-conductance mechanosensitive channel
MNQSITNVWSKIQSVLDHPLAQLGNSTVTLGGLFTLLVLLALVLILERVFRRILVERVLSRTQLEPALRFAIGRIAGYLFIALGFVMALNNAGLEISSLTVLAGAVGIGLGFGLQNIINNFFSGLIILAERPVAIGDRIEVGGVAGMVTRINMRSTTVVTNDNITIIVPNSDFISTAVTNWSHGDPKVRLRVPFGVAYGSNVSLLKRVILEVAARHPAVLKEPSPSLFFVGFGESSLDFELGVWTIEMAHNPIRFRSDLYYAIEQALRDNEIEIPFPQRDLHIRSGELPVRMRSGELDCGKEI